jgi:hypothetical protein
MNNKGKKSLHRRISAGKSWIVPHSLRNNEFVRVRVNAPISGSTSKVYSVVSLPLKKGEVAAVFKDLTVEVSVNPLGRNIVNVRGNQNQLITTKVIKHANRSGFMGRTQEPVTINLSPNLNWCDSCGYVNKGHKCPNRSKGLK